MTLLNVETLKKAFWNKATIENKRGNASIAKGVLYCYDFVVNRVKPVDPVRHGYWVKNEVGTVKCSACKHQAHLNLHGYELFDFCPYCGAKMDAGV